MYVMTANHFINTQHLAALVLILLYLSLFILEKIRPLRQATHPLLPRIFVNFSLTIMVLIVAAVLVSPLAKWAITLTQVHDFGLLTLMPGNKLLRFVTGFLLMDLTFYYWHRLNHQIPFLWRFHNVHHVDPDLDVTTSMRFHVGEIALSGIFRVIQAGVIGMTPLNFFCYEVVFQASTFFQHSNLKLPIRVERLLNLLFVTPRMHGIHHSDYRDETNRNYGIVFSFWDRLHRSSKLNVPQQAITIGVPGYVNPSDNTVPVLLLMPVRAQRRYWKEKNTTRVDQVQDQLTDVLSG